MPAGTAHLQQRLLPGRGRGRRLPSLPPRGSVPGVWLAGQRGAPGQASQRQLPRRAHSHLQWGAGRQGGAHNAGKHLGGWCYCSPRHLNCSWRQVNQTPPCEAQHSATPPLPPSQPRTCRGVQRLAAPLLCKHARPQAGSGPAVHQGKVDAHAARSLAFPPLQALEAVDRAQSTRAQWALAETGTAACSTAAKACHAA